MMHHHKEVRNDAPCAKRYKMMLGLEIDMYILLVVMSRNWLTIKHKRTKAIMKLLLLRLRI